MRMIAMLSNSQRKTLLVTMLRIRLFEELVYDLIGEGRLPGTTHLYIGEEAVAAGVCLALHDSDCITSTHRGHGHCIAKGGQFDRMLAEMLGKRSGYCRGKGGSMHIADFEAGILGANGVVGGSIGIATGASFSIKKRGEKRVVVCFFGDGAINQGLFYECLNMAKIWNLPIIYLCENNLYAISMHSEDSTGQKHLSNRIKGFGVASYTIDGNDVEKLYNSTSDLKNRCLSGEGPFFLECMTYRFGGHSRSDKQPYRSKDEVDAWKKRDPIDLYVDKLVALNIITGIEYEEMREEVSRELDRALSFAEHDRYPSEHELYRGLYADVHGTETASR
jgi:TPP-dependent pyruvate/acetoin dehydrogenase alpha subunit